MVSASIANSNVGMAAFARFATANTWNAQQIFKSPSATVAGGVFQSSGTVSAVPAGYGSSNLVAQFIAEESAIFPYTLYESTGNSQGHILAFRTSRGTYASRTAVQFNDILGQLNFGGHNGTNLVDGKAKIQAVAGQNWTAGSNGSYLDFYVTSQGTTTSSLGLRLSMGDVLAGHNAQFFGSLFLENNTSINFKSLAGVSESVLSITNANNIQIVSPTASGNIALTNRATSGAITLTAGTSTGSITLAAGGSTRVTVASGGKTTFSSTAINIATAQTPATSAAAGTAGDIAWDDTYLYVRMSTGWRRIALGAAF